MSIDLQEQDPDAARFNAIAASVLFALIGCIVGFVAAGLFVGTGEPVGWLIIGVCTATGAIPIARWASDRRNTDHLDLFDIDRSLRPLLARAAAATNRIERAAAAAPDGPVSELLANNHLSALAQVKLLEHDARSGGVACGPEVLRACHQLDELADTSERLLETARGSMPTVLNALTERTALVNEVLRRDLKNGASEALDEDGHADRGATNGH